MLKNVVEILIIPLFLISVEYELLNASGELEPLTSSFEGSKNIDRSSTLFSTGRNFTWIKINE